MSKVALSLFKSNAAIGTLQPDGSVLPSPEFVRAMSALFARAGGAAGMSSEDLAVLASVGPQPDLQARRMVADVQLSAPVDQGGAMAALSRRVADLQAQVMQIDSIRAEMASLRRRMEGAELQVGYRDPFRVDWGRPGQIGTKKAAAATFTTLTATGAFGCNGKSAQTPYALGAAATDLASAIALANNLRTMSINNGTGS
jgi:hypothetical protein